MTRMRLAAAACLVVLLAGCASNRFLATLPPVDGTYVVDSQPIELFDDTGLVTGLEVITDPMALIGRTWVAPRTAEEPGLRVEWGGGMCEDRTRMRLERSGSAFVLRIEHDRSLGALLGCPAALVYHAVILRLREAIDADAVGIVVEND